jgi:hypothetical protein
MLRPPDAHPRAAAQQQCFDYLTLILVLYFGFAQHGAAQQQCFDLPARIHVPQLSIQSSFAKKLA